MNFCDRTTTYTVFRDRNVKESPREWYERLLPTMGDPLVAIQCQLEIQWLEDGRPYYSVFPVIADALRRVKLDVPCDTIIPPLDRWLIRFPEPGLEVEGRLLRSILCASVIAHNSQWDGPGLAIYADFGESRVVRPGLPEYPVYSYRVFGLRQGTTVEEAISPELELVRQLEDDTPAVRAELAAVVRLVCGVCLVCKDPDLVLPDVLNKHAEKYDATMEQSYVETAHRRGKVGWLIGREVEAMPHYRRPHFAIRWTGAGRTIPRLTAISGSVVHRNALTTPQGTMDADTERRERERREKLALQLIATHDAIRQRTNNAQ